LRFTLPKLSLSGVTVPERPLLRDLFAFQAHYSTEKNESQAFLGKKKKVF